MSRLVHVRQTDKKLRNREIREAKNGLHADCLNLYYMKNDKVIQFKSEEWISSFSKFQQWFKK